MIAMRWFALLAAALLAAAPAGAAEKLKAVATFSILGDMTARVGGEHVDVATLIGPDGDAHVFDPRPADIALLSGARVFVANGLGFEPWAERAARAAGFSGVPIVASNGVAAAETGGNGHDGHDHGPADPHAWQDLANGVLYVRNIADGLAAADPANAAAYQANAAAYIAELQGLDAWVRAELGRIPPERRKVITSHDAFGYFGRAYGLSFLAAAGLSTESEPGARDLARLVDLMRREGAKVVFMENMTDPRVIETVAAETGAVVGGALYADALSPPGGPAPTYIEMFRHNVRQLAAALAQS